jgi:hypothetical protein
VGETDMSIAVMSNVWEKARGVKSSQLLLLLALADFADDNGKCWPKIETLAHKIRMSERQTIRLLQVLDNDGHIETKRRTKDGLKTSNLYQLAKLYRCDKLSYRSDIAMSPNKVTPMSHKPSYNRQKDNNFETPGVIK